MRVVKLLPLSLAVLGGMGTILVLVLDFLPGGGPAYFGPLQVMAAALLAALMAAGLGLTLRPGRRWLESHRQAVTIVVVWVALGATFVVLAQGGLQVWYRIARGAWFWEKCRIELSRCGLYAAHDYGEWRVRPDLKLEGSTDGHPWKIVTNSAGFRGPMPRTDSGEGELTILVVGDSFTFGWGVNEDERYTAVLEEELKSSRSAGVQVITMGVPSWGIQQELSYIRSEGILLEPDLVVLQFYPYDWEVLRSEGIGVADGFLVRGSGASEGSVTVVLTRYLVLYDRVNRAISRLAHTVQSPFRRSSQVSALPEDLPADPSRFFRAGPQPTAQSAAVERSVEALGRVHDILSDQGIPLAIMVIPTVFQVYPDRAARWLGPDTENYDLDKPQRLLAQLCRERDWRCLDLLPVFTQKARERPQPLYFPIDPHFTPDGHQEAGTALAEWLTGLGY